MGYVVLKDPNAVLDYSYDWSEDYLQTGETISSQTWAVEGASSADASPLAVTGTPTESAGVTTAMVTAGTQGEVYTLRNRIITSAGRTDDRSWTIRIGSR